MPRVPPHTAHADRSTDSAKLRTFGPLRSAVPVAFVIVALACVVTRAQSMTSKTLDRVKQGMVRLRIERGTKQAHATGFVVKVDKENVYIATAADAIERPSPETAAPADTPPDEAKVDATLPGLANAIVATVVDIDRELGVAILKTVVPKEAPVALDPGLAPVKLQETLPVFAFGFVEDEADAPVAVEKCSVASVRKSAPDEAGWIRLDVDLDAGLLGGPVVDAAGRLVGLCRATGGEDKGCVLAPRGEVKQLVDEVLKGRRVKTAVKRNPKGPPAAAAAPGASRLVFARWGQWADQDDPLEDPVDVTPLFTKILDSGTVTELDFRLFPPVQGRGVPSLHAAFQVGDETVELFLTFKSRVLMTKPAPELAARREAILIDSAIWSFDDATGSDARDVTATVRDKAISLVGCRAGPRDLPELGFGKPKVLVVRVKVGNRQLDLRMGEPSVIRISGGKK